jgi:hypothetical protein
MEKVYRRPQWKMKKILTHHEKELSARERLEREKL